MDSTSVKQLNTLVIDSIEYIKRVDVADFYAHIADKQATQFTILISVICSIVVLIIGATWWWNYKGAKQQISDEIGTTKRSLIKLLEAHTKNLNNELAGFRNNFNGFKGSMQESINRQIDKNTSENIKTSLKEINDHINKIKEEQEKDLTEFKIKVTKEIESHQAELSRIFALHCDTTSAPLTAAGWWLDAAEHYKVIQSDNAMGVSIRAALSSLKKVNESSINTKTSFDFDVKIKTANQVIPPCMNSDKNQILTLLKKLKKKKEDTENPTPAKV